MKISLIIKYSRNTGVKEIIESAKEMQEILEPIKMIKELFEIWNFILSFRNIKKKKDGNGGVSNII